LQNREEIWQKSQLEINSQHRPQQQQMPLCKDEIIEQEVEEAVAYLKPPPIDETMPETESESSSDDK